MHRLSSKYLVITSDYVLPSFIVLGVITLFWLTFYSSLFTVSSIICETDYKPCENNALEAELAKFKGENIFRLDVSLLKKRILSGEFTVRGVEVKRELPGQLRVMMQSVLPTLAVKGEGDPRYLTLDSQYRVIKVTTTPQNVISLIVPTLPPVQVGKNIGTEYESLFKLVSSLNQKLMNVEGVVLRQDGSIAVSLKEITAIMSPSVDLDRQISLLQLILADSTIIAGKQQVDVRFAQPVLR